MTRIRMRVEIDVPGCSPLAMAHSIAKRAGFCVLSSDIVVDRCAFGPMLRSLREKRGVTMGQLARHLGVSVTYLSNVELGKAAPPAVTMVKKAAQLIGADPKSLMRAAFGALDQGSWTDGDEDLDALSVLDAASDALAKEGFSKSAAEWLDELEEDDGKAETP